MADPAVGTGTFLLGVLRQIAATSRPTRARARCRRPSSAAAERLIGFEMQFGPFAVAQLRADRRTAATDGGKPPTCRSCGCSSPTRWAIPIVEEEQARRRSMQPIAESRRQANEIKREEPITVVIGNPPYKEKAKGRGGWIEERQRRAGQAPMDRWMPPAGLGRRRPRQASEESLCLFLALGHAGRSSTRGTTRPAAGQDDDGIVCFITVAGFLNGPGFQKMRDDLRRDCRDIWVIDCSPEGHQPDVADAHLPGRAAAGLHRAGGAQPSKDRDEPARVRFTALPKGQREEKFAALAELELDGEELGRMPDRLARAVPAGSDRRLGDVSGAR